MAKRTITHFKVGASLFNDITNLLFNLPASQSRDILNRIESKTGEGECEPIFKIDLRKARKVRKPPAKKKARKKVAKRKRSA